MPLGPNNVAPRHDDALDFAEFQARLSAEIQKVELNAARQVADLRADFDVRAGQNEKEMQDLEIR